MSIEMEIVIDANEYEVDMKSSLDTFQGISNTVRKVTETVIDEKLHQKLNPIASVRTKLKRSFKGSYGIQFKIEFHTDDAKKRYRYLGKETIIELYTYFISESLYLNHPKPSKKASLVLEALGEKSIALIESVRNNLEDIHKANKNFGHKITLNFVKNRNEKKRIVEFNFDTSNVITLKKDNKSEIIRVIINRFNTFTGNGRLLLEGNEKTHSFGFPVAYKDVNRATKKSISDNLNVNNGKEEDDYIFVELNVTKLKTMNGKIVKYYILGIV